jgi:hypothetical protein
VRGVIADVQAQARDCLQEIDEALGRTSKGVARLRKECSSVLSVRRPADEQQ